MLLAKEAVAAAAQEALRRQGSLDAQLSKELNTNQVAFLQQEVARMREDLGNNLEAAKKINKLTCLILPWVT